MDVVSRMEMERAVVVIEKLAAVWLRDVKIKFVFIFGQLHLILPRFSLRN